MGILLEDLSKEPFLSPEQIKFNTAGLATSMNKILDLDISRSEFQHGRTQYTTTSKDGGELSNPPYGKSWASEQKYIKDGKEIIDPRFQIRLKNYWGVKRKMQMRFLEAVMVSYFS